MTWLWSKTNLGQIAASSKLQHPVFHMQKLCPPVLSSKLFPWSSGQPFLPGLHYKLAELTQVSCQKYKYSIMRGLQGCCYSWWSESEVWSSFPWVSIHADAAAVRGTALPVLAAVPLGRGSCASPGCRQMPVFTARRYPRTRPAAWRGTPGLSQERRGVEQPVPLLSGEDLDLLWWSSWDLL